MLQHPSEFDELVCWSEDGECVLVDFGDENLADDLLPRVYGHANPAGFGRELPLLSSLIILITDETMNRSQVNSSFTDSNNSKEPTSPSLSCILLPQSPPILPPTPFPLDLRLLLPLAIPKPGELTVTLTLPKN